MTEYNADKAQDNVAREEAAHEEALHNKTTQEKAAQKKASQKKSAQEVTASEQRKAEEEALKKRLALRVTAPGHKYPWHRWAIPVVGETTAGIGAILIPVMVGQFINQHIAGKAPDAWPMFWVVVASITFIVINEFFGWGTSMTLSAELGRDWRAYINRLMGRTRTTVDAGEAVTVMNKDVRRVTNVYFSLPLFVNAMIIATLGAVQLWLINPVTAVVTLIGTLIVVGVIAWYSTFLESKIGEYREKDGEASSRASDIATGLRTIAGLGAEEQMRERYHRGTDEVFDSYMRYEKTHRWMFLIRALLGGAVTLLGIGFALTGHVENGRWVSDTPAASLVTVASIIAMMGGPIWITQNFLTEWRYAKIALAKIARLEGHAGVRQGVLKSPRTDEEMAQLARAEQAVEASTLEVPVPVAPAGASNPRIVYVNPRDYNLTAQDYAEALARTLRRGGEDLKDASGRRVLLSEPNPMIFAGTLQEHLRLGTVPNPDEELAQAKDEELLKITDSREIAYRLGGRNPEDYFAARITTEGANLSGGQRQRLALARALAQDAQVLILTEPLNSVDEPSQRYIYDAMETQVGSDRLPVGYPGLLQDLEQVYVVSTTAETTRRMERDGYPAADSGTPATTQNQEVN